MLPIILFLLSIGLQLAAAIYALLLVRVTGRKLAWILISAAMVLMTTRRIVSFISMVIAGKAIRFDLPEIIALAIASLMLLGVLLIRGHFLAFSLAEMGRRKAESELKTYREQLEHMVETRTAELTEAEEKFRVITDTAQDGVIMIDNESNVLFWNKAAERIFGHAREEVLGKAMYSLIIPERFRDEHLRGFGKFKTTGEGQLIGKTIEVPAVRKDGTEFPIELSISAVRLRDKWCATGIIRDITERKKIEDELQKHRVHLEELVTARTGELQTVNEKLLREIGERKRMERLRDVRYAVARVVAEFASLEEAAPQLLREICERLGWDIGSLWTVERGAEQLRFQATWQAPLIAAEEFLAFSRRTAFEPGIGLPGRVLQNGRPAWIEEVATDGNFPRASVAVKAGLHSAFAFPLMLGNRVVGVMEFFSRETRAREPDEEVFTMLLSSGVQIGQFIERKRAEEALRESEDRYRRLVELFPDGVVIQTEDRFAFANEALARILGADGPAKLIGRPVWDYLHHDYSDRGAGDGKSGGRVGLVEEKAVRSDGSPVDVEVAAVPIRYQGLASSLAVVRDITVRKQTEKELKAYREHLEDMVKTRTAELQAANKDLESFSYSVSHDLRAPLRAIEGFSRILTDEYSVRLDDEGRRLLTVVRENTQRMGALIEDILAFSRVGRAEVNLAEINMEELANAVYQDLKPAAGGRNIQCEIGRLPPAIGDRAMMKQVLTNLLSNAIKFTRTRDEAKIEVGALESDGVTVYAVRDNGVGFDMRYAEKLFGVFQRLHGMDEFEGTGIGLSIVKRVIDKHGGSVCFEAEPGKGAAFYFTLRGK